MTNQLVRHFTVQVPIRECRLIESNGGRGHEWITTGYKTATVEVSVDIAAALRLAERAAGNRGMKSKAGPCYAKAHFSK